MKAHALASSSLMVVALATVAFGKNVDLVTLPTRDTVQLTIYNSEDLTLARETRFITLKKGSNKLQFSWAGTLIDPTSVELRPLDHADAIAVVDTVYPGQKPQHLIWNIQSDIEGQVPVEVSYFTSGLTWQMDYVTIADPKETSLDFRGYVRVYNNSGEEYDNARIRLIVGKINLVEKIAQLAQKHGMPVPKSGRERERLAKEAARFAFDVADAEFDDGTGGDAPDRAKQIVKEGLSEYFIFSVEGTETIRNGWSKRMRAVTADDVAFDIVYRMRAYQYGPRPVRFFTWRNDQEHKLGDSPLPNGMVRVFRRNGRDGLSYLGQQNLNYVPVRAEIEVNLGADDLVVYDRRRADTSRLNFAFHSHTKQVIGWDERQRWGDTVRNYRDKPIRFELRLQINGDVELGYEHETSSFDYNTVQTELDVPTLGAVEYSYLVTIHHASNAKQDKVRLIPPQ